MRLHLFLFFNQKKVYVTILTSFISFMSIHAQSLMVKGNVTGEGETMPGVSVIVKGTDRGTTTDFDGNYEIKASATDVLVFNYIGFVKKEIPIGDKTILNVVLDVDVSQLEEVVVIGYGTQKKKELTGAVVQVSSDNLNKTSTADVGSALQGLIAGVNVQASSGAPGSNANILIRGLSSIIGQSAPLYVVDGIPFDGDPGLSISEIETVDVLKDAASASIYGTRGAGGVILITTKRGKLGRMKIGVNSYYGIQNITSGVPLLNFEENLYVRFLSSYHNDNAFNSSNSWTPLEINRFGFTNDTDLTKIFQNDHAPIQNHNISISGGREGLTYNINANYFRQEGMLIRSKFDRFNTRLNTSYRKGKWNINTGVSLRMEQREYEPWGLLTSAYRYHPFQQNLNTDQNVIQDAGGNGSNEAINLGGLAYRLLQSDIRDGDHFSGFIQAEYTITKGLRFMSRIGGGVTNDTRVRINPLFEIYDTDGGLVAMPERSGVYNFSAKANNYAWENSINYDTYFGDHHLRLLGVYSAESYIYSSFFAQRRDLISSEVTVLNAATADATAGSGTGWGQDRTRSLIGMSARVQYDYKGRYLFSASIRRDGSTRFSKKNRWGVFPSVSVGWNVSDEPFWGNLSNHVNAFKVRASYGTTGNENFQDYSNAATITLEKDYVFGDDGNSILFLGATQTAYANENIKWETTIQQNLGIDMGFFKNALQLSVDIYNTDKKDLLFPLLTPTSTGSGGQTVTLNVGNMNNRGFETALNYRHYGKISWQLGATYARNQNTITKMAGSNKILYLPGSRVADTNNEDLVSVIAEGYEAGAFFLIKTDGTIKNEQELLEYQTLVPTAKIGDLRYVEALTVDTNGDGILDAGDGEIDANDRQYAGSAVPDFEVGLNFSSQYKNFDFSMQWYGVFGGELMNGSKAYAYKYKTHKDLLYQWHPANPTSNIPADRGKDHANYRGYTDFWLEDGSYARLRNIALGYSLPKEFVKKIGLGRLRVYISGQNLITITKYEGFDPEIGNNALSNRGIDSGNYPVSSQFLAGIQFDF